MRQFRYWMLALWAFCALILFQNCNQPKQDGDNETEAQLVVETLKFPYDARIDQVAYTSCSGGGDISNAPGDGNPHFTFRVGAYRPYGGLRLRSSFFAETSGQTAEEQKSVLETSERSSQARLQVAVRASGNLQNIWKAGSGQEGRDYVSMFYPYDLTSLTDLLLDKALKAERLRYASDVTNPQGLRMDSKLFFMGTAVDEQRLRASFNGSSSGGRLMLALTYTDAQASSTPFAARAPADYETVELDANRAVYGKGLQLTFQQPARFTVHPQFPTPVVAQAVEVDLEGGDSAPSAWTCDPDMQFRIFRRMDLQGWNNVYRGVDLPCFEKPDPPQQSETLRIIRRSFPEEDWFVDVTNRCLIPKRENTYRCYPDLPPNEIDYHLTSQCMDANTGNGAYCVRFASICYHP